MCSGRLLKTLVVNGRHPEGVEIRSDEPDHQLRLGEPRRHVNGFAKLLFGSAGFNGSLRRSSMQ
jgi:hypothetical protein